MSPFWAIWVSIFLLLDLSVQKSVIKVNNLLFQISGNISILGIFNDRFGDECKNEADKGLEEIASAIWTVEALNKYQYLPGVTIGLTVFGTCPKANSQRDLIKMTNFLNEDSNFIASNCVTILNDLFKATLTTSEIYRAISNSEGFLRQNVVYLEHIITTDMMIQAVVQVLINLKWTNVNTVISDSAKAVKLFKEKASEEAIFVNDELLMNGRNSHLRLNNYGKSAVVVVIAEFDKISNFIQKVHDKIIKLIIIPTNFVFDIELQAFPKGTIVLLPNMAYKPALLDYIKNKLRYKGTFTPKPPTSSPLFIGTATSILKLLKPFKRKLKENCSNADLDIKQSCASPPDILIEFLSNKTNLVSQKSMEILADDVEESLKVLKIEQNSNSEMFLYITTVINGNVSEDLAIFQIFSLKSKMFHPVLLMIKDDMLNDNETMLDTALKSDYFHREVTHNEEFSLSRNPVFNLLQKLSRPSGENERFENTTVSKNPLEKGCDSDDQSNMCPNLPINHTAVTQTNDTAENIIVAWRFLTWVSINTSLGFVGVTCTLSAMFFIIIKRCKDDSLEGSPCFLILLMISVIFTYISSVPFHVDFLTDNAFMCGYRQNGPCVIFALLFSLLLSRSFVLAFSEDGKEFNGYLQFILCFFMFGVQISIVLQNWIFEKGSFDLGCSDLHDKYKILLSLSYDFLLLFLVACVSPFIVRVKRNNKEGLFFSIGAFFITIVWSAWLSFYILLPKEHKDAAIAIGLNSTASVFLFCIFIPQTYLMAGSFGQDSTLRSFSTLDSHLRNVSNVNFKSNEFLGTITYKNSEMGLSNPNFSTIPSNENCDRETVIEVSPDSAN